ncbi:hypothetical protein K458DRAFT_423520 [Lentithecium fluviatile CBS 122367]|uniref:Uncharacterized protein n=1 Tax=Lentithecium fluviatile CBS 122367 TaxID=1168545 RepID=A0A6G1IIB2_9PLEO|nr:hypothetical protein K458DRAFT_423520 [Lentithecium fluviatile CBS 122367]
MGIWKTVMLRPDLHDTSNLNATARSFHSDHRSMLPISNSKSQIESRHTSDKSMSSTPSKPLLDAREQFAIGPPHDAQFPTPQLEPKILPGFTATARQAYNDICSTCVRLVYVIEQGLGLPINAISGPAAGGAGAELNLNFYPEVERRVLGSGIAGPEADSGDNGQSSLMRRIWPHSDLGVVSALLQDGAGASGLEMQVQEPDKTGGAFTPLDMERGGR